MSAVILFALAVRTRFLKCDANVVIVHVLWENYLSASRPDMFDVFGAV